MQVYKWRQEIQKELHLQVQRERHTVTDANTLRTFNQQPLIKSQLSVWVN